MIRVADYIFKYLADYGVRHVFLVTGGGAMYLNDALKKEKRINFVCTHHEQGAAIAAEGYARTSGNLAVVSVTSGPGGTNALTGVIGQWLDSVPVLYLSGQVKFETTLSSVPGSGLRQLGDQEINIIDIVSTVTKYAKLVVDPLSIRKELEFAVKTAKSGRPGPVWLDIPLNVQGAMVDEDSLEGLELVATEKTDFKVNPDTLAQVAAALECAVRPIIVAGHGIRIADAQKQLIALIEKYNFPVVTTFNGFDLVPSVNEYFVGRIGTLGSRSGNFALQNSDLIICLGTRNNIRQVGYSWETFAKNAKIVLVDIDKAELNKKTVKGDYLLNCDVKEFIQKIDSCLNPEFKVDHGWLEWCNLRKRKYPVVLEEYKESKRTFLHPYYFFEMLTQLLDSKEVVVAGNGTACVALFQAGQVKQGQRIFWNSGCAAMGYALPASIGAALASGGNVICIEGDGSLQMNLQELQTIRHYNVPVKVFVLNNQGYRSIEQTQNSFFKADYIGCNKDSGVSFPDNSKLADLFGLAYFRIDSTSCLETQIQEALAAKGAALVEVVLDAKYIFAPKQSSERRPDGTMVSKPLEDLYPFLSRTEFDENMIVKEESSN